MSVFQFKQFSIHHTRSAMKVGTDSILLGSLAHHPAPASILDIGCGTGLLSLMLAQKYPVAELTLIDTDRKAVSEARSNVRRSGFKNSFSFIHEDFITRDFEKSFDLIISNPPFHNEAIHSPFLQRNMARSTSSLPIENIIQKVSQLLTPLGKFFLILPLKMDTFLSEQLLQVSLHYHTRYIINSKPDNPIRIISEIALRPCDHIHNKTITIYSEKGNYTQQFRSICQSYYLKF